MRTAGEERLPAPSSVVLDSHAGVVVAVWRVGGADARDVIRRLGDLGRDAPACADCGGGEVAVLSRDGKGRALCGRCGMRDQLAGARCVTALR